MSLKTNEILWSGTFGDEYTDRNKDAYKLRWPFWETFCKKWGFDTFLEVGCNSGGNLGMIAALKHNWKDAWGCDINVHALQKARKMEPAVNIVYASGLDLPFREEYFDLAFTAGVLIHQTPETREVMMQEIIRVTNGYVMAIEYESDVFEEVPYRGHDGALFRGPWGDIYEKRYGLRLIDKFEVDKDVGFDRCTGWLLSRY